MSPQTERFFSVTKLLNLSKMDVIDRESHEYKDLIGAIKIIGGVVRDMGALTGNHTKLIEDMAKSLAAREDADKEDLANIILILAWEMADPTDG